MKEKLKEYREKRDFTVTGEPEGRVGRAKKSDLRFAVQRHAASREHYDLRLEWGGVALSWALPKGPSFRLGDKRLAVRVEDHPLGYMSFEGIIPRGEYGGGTVMLWDEGKWFPVSDPAKGLEEGSIKFRLDGKRLKGGWALVRMKGEREWLLLKERDKFAKRTAGISRFSRSILSQRSMEEIAADGHKNPFRKAEVMLARLTEELPGGGWVYELKYDGYRTLAFAEDGKAVLKTRNGYDCTSSFPSVREGLERWLGERAAVVDGEMVVAGKNGVSDFGALQAYKGGEGLRYVLFDLLALDGEDLRGRPLTERKARLATLSADAPGILVYSEHTDKMTKRELSALEKRGFEGVIAKRAGSPYTAGKNGDWVKLKFRKTDEFAVCGYKEGNGGLASLLLAAEKEGEWRFVGTVGTGFSEETKEELLKELKGLVRRDPVCALPKAENIVWVEPVLVAEVAFAEVTKGGSLRQASFKGIRRDKLPEATGRETPSPPRPVERGGTASPVRVLGIAISHPEKEMFPDRRITKGQVAGYYAQAAPRMMPYLRDRVLSVVCCPSGIDGEKFFRRHLDGSFGGVGQTAADGGGFYVKSAKGIAALAQYNALEFHIHACKRTGVPDLMTFDLDPDERLPLAEVKRGVRLVKEVLDGIGLVSFLKTSGGKGYHVVVPLCGGEPEAFKTFSRRVAELLAGEYPLRFTSSPSKRSREGKIYVDYLRNGAGATSAAPYSLRARAGAPVSMPISWEELDDVAPNGIDLFSAAARLADDPWADFFLVKKSQRMRSRGRRDIIL